MAVKIRRERPDQRRHHRVSAPLFVRVDGHHLRARDWSLGGLRVEDYPGVLPRAGAEKTLQVTLPFQGFDVSFEVRAEVVRTIPEMKAFAARFTEVGERERELMQHFIEELVRGSMSEVEDTIQRIDVPVTPARLEPDAVRDVPQLPVRRVPVKTIAMTAIYGVLGLVVFGYAGLLGYANFYRMEIQTAVISAPVETVTARTDGQIVWSNLKPGDPVKQGDVVVSVVDNEIEREIELAGIAVQERKAQLAFLKKLQADELEKLQGFAKYDMKTVEQGRIEYEGLRQQFQLAEQQLGRIQQLFDKGYTTATKLDEARKQVIALKSQMDQRKVELASRATLADENFGKRLFTGNNLLGAGQEIEAKVNLAEHEIKLAQSRQQSYMRERERAAVTAPFDGTVLDLPKFDQGSVRKGDTIAIIEERRQRNVTAYLTQDEILKVGLGDEALIYVPAIGETLKGRVREIDRTSGFVREQFERQNPGYGWRGPHDRSAKITIEFDEAAKVADIERYRSGLPVVVVFEQRSTNSILTALKNKLAVAL